MLNYEKLPRNCIVHFFEEDETYYAINMNTREIILKNEYEVIKWAKKNNEWCKKNYDKKSKFVVKNIEDAIKYINSHTGMNIDGFVIASALPIDKNKLKLFCKKMIETLWANELVPTFQYVKEALMLCEDKDIAKAFMKNRKFYKGFDLKKHFKIKYYLNKDEDEIRISIKPTTKNAQKIMNQWLRDNNYD